MSAQPEALFQRIRPMRASDLPLVMHNENRSYSHPWTEGVFRDCLAGMYHCWVLENERRRPVGHVVVQMVLDEAHVLNLCVAPEHQRQGLGKGLLQFTIEQAKLLNAVTLFLEVRVGNEAAQGLYRRAGFSEIGRRKGYYPAESGREDGVVMVRAL